MKPGATAAQNPHHFVVIQVDGDNLSVEVIGTGPAAYTPYNGTSKIALNDQRSISQGSAAGTVGN